MKTIGHGLNLAGIFWVGYGARYDIDFWFFGGMGLLILGYIFLVFISSKTSLKSKIEAIKTPNLEQNPNDKESEYFDTIIKYAVEKGFNATIASDMDENGVTTFYLAHVGEDKEIKKLVEVHLLDESITKDKNAFNEVIETVKEKLDNYIKENK